MIARLNYFYKILLSFLLIGLLPLMTLGIFFYLFSTNIVQTMYMDQALGSIVKMADAFDQYLDEYRDIAWSLSEDELISEALSSGVPPPGDISARIYQKLYSSMSGKLYRSAIYIIGRRGIPVFSTRPLPLMYETAIFENWGILGKIRSRPDAPVVYPQRHELGSSDDTRLSVGWLIPTPAGLPAGYLVADLYRPGIVDVLTRNNAGFFAELVLNDTNGYIVLNLAEPESEGKFGLHSGGSPGRGNGVYRDRFSVTAFSGVGNEGLALYGKVPLSSFTSSFDTLRSFTIIFSLVSFLICLMISFLLSKSISDPVHTLVRSMQSVEKGDLLLQLENTRTDEIGILFNGFNRMVSRIRILVEDTIEEHRRLRTAEIKALQAQINPHFLYNTLNSIKAIARLHHVEQISTIVTHLGKLLRNSIHNGKEMSTLEESVELVSSYLEIQKIRYGNKLNTRIDVPPEVYPCILPKLVLQPVVENAVVHGIENKIGSGTINITGRIIEDVLVLTVTDDGTGIPPERLAFIRSRDPAEGPEGIAIRNIRKRLALYYGTRGSLEIESTLAAGTTVTIRIPCTLSEVGP